MKIQGAIVAPSHWCWCGHHTLKFYDKVLFFYVMAKALSCELFCTQMGPVFIIIIIIIFIVSPERYFF